MPLTENEMKEILKDPAAAYKKPQDVLDDERLSLEDKKEILRCWEEDMEALLRAAEENMPPPEKTPTTGDQLAEISKMRQELEES